MIRSLSRLMVAQAPKRIVLRKLTTRCGPSGATLQTITENGVTIHVNGVAYRGHCNDKEGKLRRDLSIEVCTLFTETILRERAARCKIIPVDTPTYHRLSTNSVRLLDCATSSGLRSIRYVKEVPGLTHVTTNCPDQDKIAEVENNVAANKKAGVTMKVTRLDSKVALYSAIEEAYDIVDVEPNRHLESHLDGAVQAVAPDGGLLCITSPDLQSLRGTYPEVCFAKFGSTSMETPYDSELALRILLQAVEGAANRHKRMIVPWVSAQCTSGVRLFVRVYESSAMLTFGLPKRMFVLQSSGCSTFHTQAVGQTVYKHDETAAVEVPQPVQLLNDRYLGRPGIKGEELHGTVKAVVSMPAKWEAPAVCEESGAPWRVMGPVWAGRLHDPVVTSELFRRVRARVAAVSRTSPNGRYTRMAGKGKGKQNLRQSQQTLQSPLLEAGDGEEGGGDGLEGAESAEESDSDVPVIDHAQAQLAQLLYEISTELPDAPLHYDVQSLIEDINAPRTLRTHDLMAALLHAGYQASGFHGHQRAVKTNAPSSVVWDILRCYCRRRDVQRHSKPRQTEVGAALRHREPSLEANFLMHPEVRKWVNKKKPYTQLVANSKK